MTSFYNEVERAKGSIERHVGKLTALQQRLDAEYDSVSDSLLSRADDFGPREFRAFKKLGELRRLRMLNLATISSFQYLRATLRSAANGIYILSPTDRSIETDYLRSMNRALSVPTQRQIERLERAVLRYTKKELDNPPGYDGKVSLSIMAVDEDVARIFGEALSISRV
jgi:hypothetical protein